MPTDPKRHHESSTPQNRHARPSPHRACRTAREAAKSVHCRRRHRSLAPVRLHAANRRNVRRRNLAQCNNRRNGKPRRFKLPGRDKLRRRLRSATSAWLRTKRHLRRTKHHLRHSRDGSPRRHHVRSRCHNRNGGKWRVRNRRLAVYPASRRIECIVRRRRHRKLRTRSRVRRGRQAATGAIHASIMSECALRSVPAHRARNTDRSRAESVPRFPWLGRACERS